MESKIHGIEHSYFEIKRLISAIAAKYPFVGVSNIGKSAAGREIPVLTLGATGDFTLFIAGEDPSCRITTLMLLKFIWELSEKILAGEQMCGINIRKAMFGRGVAVLPLINPDGYEIALRGENGCGHMAQKISKLCGGDFSKWRSNLRGVEISRNFFSGFEQRRCDEREHHICGPRYEGFSGYRPESESETTALADFCRNKNVRQLINLSAFGKTVMYSGNPVVPPRSVKMAEVMAAVTSFTVTPPISNADFGIGDWFTYEFCRPALAVKIGVGSAPPVSELTYWYARLRELLTLSCLF